MEERRKNNGHATSVLFLLLTIISGFASCSRPPIPASLETVAEDGIYVWNRVHNDSVRSAIANAQAQFSQIVVLAGEVYANASNVSTTATSVDFSSFANYNGTLILCYRIESWAAGAASIKPLLNKITTSITSHVATAKDNNVTISGIQIDYDCPTSKLPHYTAFLNELVRSNPSLPVSITTLPTWLSSKAFPDLLAPCEHFVLQVHSLDPKTRPQDSPKLVNLDQTLRWATKASHLNKAFQIALPTYSYRLHYDSTGRFAGVTSETNSPPAEELTWKALHASPREIADIAHRLRTTPIPNLQRLIWFRMPSQSDSMNWNWTTLEAVRHNTLDTKPINLIALEESPNLVTLYLENNSNLPAPFPSGFTVTIPPSQRLAWDILGYYASSKPDAEQIEFTLLHPDRNALIQPNEQIGIAWFRLTNSPSQSTIQLSP